MAFKAVSLCVIAFLVQSSAGLSCYRPPAPSCGCNSESVSIAVSESESPSYYRLPPKPSSNRVSIDISETGGYQPSSSCVSIAVPNNGGALAVTSVGPIAPSGIAVAADLGLSGDLYLSGELPYLSAVAFDGQFASSGVVPVSYGCGDSVAITEQLGGSPNLNAISLNLNNINRGCGCGQ